MEKSSVSLRTTRVGRAEPRQPQDSAWYRTRIASRKPTVGRVYEGREFATTVSSVSRIVAARGETGCDRALLRGVGHGRDRSRRRRRGGAGGGRRRRDRASPAARGPRDARGPGLGARPRARPADAAARREPAGRARADEGGEPTVPLPRRARVDDRDRGG